MDLGGLGLDIAKGGAGPMRQEVMLQLLAAE